MLSMHNLNYLGQRSMSSLQDYLEAEQVHLNLEVYVFHYQIEISQLYMYLNPLSPTLELRFV